MSLFLSTQSLRSDWKQLALLPEPNGGFMAGCVGGRIVVAGGTNWRDDVKRWLDKVWVFEPAAGRWAAAPALPHPLAYAACASDGDRLYLAGGTDGQQGRREVYALDSRLRLTRLGELPRSAIYSAAAAVAGQLVIVGGTPEPDGWGKVTADGWRVDLKNGKSATLARLPGLSHGIGIPAVAAAGDRTYVVGGGWLDPSDGQVRNVATAFAMDGVSGDWQAVAPYPRSVRGLSAVALNDHQIYLAGGYGQGAEGSLGQDGFLNAAYVYDARNNGYIPATPLPFSAITCLVACEDYVYAIGGEDLPKHRTDACWRIRISELSLSAGR